MARLCFDYGHGGEDSGACYNGRKESNDVLSLGIAVAAEVRRHGVTVDETRTLDATVSLNERSAFENRNTYDYFISFHRNAYEPEKAKAPAVLVEIGFIDNSEDNSLFDAKRNEIIRGLSKVILSVIGIYYIEASASTQSTRGQTLYRVMAGSYSVRENAENQVEKLKAAGFDATIMIFNR